MQGARTGTNPSETGTERTADGGLAAGGLTVLTALGDGGTWSGHSHFPSSLRGDPAFSKHNQDDKSFTEAYSQNIHCEEVSIISQNSRPVKQGVSLLTCRALSTLSQRGPQGLYGQAWEVAAPPRGSFENTTGLFQPLHLLGCAQPTVSENSQLWVP